MTEVETARLEVAMEHVLENDVLACTLNDHHERPECMECEDRRVIFAAVRFYQKQHEALRLQLQRVTQEKDDAQKINADAAGYLGRLFIAYWPQCESTFDLLSLCTQIDNGIWGLSDRAERAEADLLRVTGQKEKLTADLDEIVAAFKASCAAEVAMFGSKVIHAGRCAQEHNALDLVLARVAKIQFVP